MTDDIARSRRRTRMVLAAAAVMTLATLVTILTSGLGHWNVPVAQPVAAAVDDRAAGREPTSTSPGVAATLVVGAVRWVSAAGAQVPVSVTAGPRDSRDGLATGFTRDAAGAVFAAVHISVRLSPQAGPAVFEPTLREQVVGADAAALGEHLDEEYADARTQLGLSYGMPAGRLYSTATGYQVAMDSPDAATVRLLIEGPRDDGGSAWVVLTAQMRWTGTDWALQAPGGGDPAADAVVVTNPDGFTRFPDGG
jgi:hypothetical protein